MHSYILFYKYINNKHANNLKFMKYNNLNKLYLNQNNNFCPNMKQLLFGFGHSLFQKTENKKRPRDLNPSGVI
jgi:hypothetical protein